MAELSLELFNRNMEHHGKLQLSDWLAIDSPGHLVGSDIPAFCLALSDVAVSSKKEMIASFDNTLFGW